MGIVLPGIMVGLAPLGYGGFPSAPPIGPEAMPVTVNVKSPHNRTHQENRRRAVIRAMAATKPMPVDHPVAGMNRPCGLSGPEPQPCR